MMGIYFFTFVQGKIRKTLLQMEGKFKNDEKNEQPRRLVCI